MAVKVWLLQSGVELAGHPAFSMPFDTCVLTLGLCRGGWVCGPEHKPTFGNESYFVDGVRVPRYVAAEVDADEASARGWPPGFYYVWRCPAEVVELFGPARGASGS